MPEPLTFTDFTPSEQVEDVLNLLHSEILNAMRKHASYNSAHESFAVLLEEVEEYKAEVWKKSALRDKGAMANELLQVATVAVRSIIDLALLEGFSPEVSANEVGANIDESEVASQVAHNTNPDLLTCATAARDHLAGQVAWNQEHHLRSAPEFVTLVNNLSNAISYAKGGGLQ